jgi:hypothetical protein
MALTKRLQARPLPVSDGRVLTETDAITGLADAMYVPQLWESAVLALSEAIIGRGQRLLGLADELFQRTDAGAFKDNSNESNIAVNCLDHPGDDTVTAAQGQTPVMRAVSPVFGESFAWGNLACAGMPRLDPAPVAGPIRALGAAPILIVGTTHDPATPYPWARALAGQLASAVLLTREGDGHTGYGRGNHCVDGDVDGYLLDGRLPKDGTRC